MLILIFGWDCGATPYEGVVALVLAAACRFFTPQLYTRAMFTSVVVI